MNSNAARIPTSNTACSPTLRDGEALLYTATVVNARWIEFAFVFTFIFFFVFYIGLLSFLFSIYVSRNSGLWVTDQRVIYYRMRGPRRYSYYEVPVRAIWSATVIRGLVHPCNAIDVLFESMVGVGTIAVEVGSTGGFKGRVLLPHVKRPADVADLICHLRSKC